MVKLMGFIVITQMVLYMLPGEQYRKYAKLIIGLLLMIFMLQLLNRVTESFSLQGITNLFGVNAEKLNYENKSMQEIEELRNHAVLSTCENNVKDRLNKMTFPNNYGIKSVKIDICEDVDNVDYGQIRCLQVIFSKNVDKSANIMVDRIIVGKQDENTDNILINQFKKEISEELMLSEEVIEVVICEE